MPYPPLHRMQRVKTASDKPAADRREAAEHGWIKPHVLSIILPSSGADGKK
jgi:hypothetical protein